MLIDFKKTAIPAAKTLNSLVMASGPGRVAIELSSTSSKGKKGTYASPVIKPIKVTEDVLQAARDHFTFGRSQED